MKKMTDNNRLEQIMDDFTDAEPGTAIAMTKKEAEKLGAFVEHAIDEQDVKEDRHDKQN